MLSYRRNYAASSRGTLRGFHYQRHRPQAKLCRVVEGEGMDVAVDIRVGSPHFVKRTSVLLSAKDLNQIYVPVGFAHAYLALSDEVQFLYKCSDFYDPADEHGVLWNDFALNISWGIDVPLSSEDSRNPKFADVALDLPSRYSGK